MSIATEIIRTRIFEGDGTNSIFPFDFKIFDKSDISVYASDSNGVERLLVLDFDYSVQFDAKRQDDAAGGQIVLKEPLPVGHKLVGKSNHPYLQPISFTNLGGFYPNVLNNGLDRSVILDLQNKEELGRALKVGVMNEDVSTTLPSPRANSFLAWDEDGKGLINISPESDSISASLEATRKAEEAASLVKNMQDEFKRYAGFVEAESKKLVQNFNFLKSIQELRSFLGAKNPAVVSGYYEGQFVGGGTYNPDLSDKTSQDNGGTVIVATDGTRWKLAGVPTVYNFGARGDGVADDTAAVVLFSRWSESSGLKSRLPNNKCKVSLPLSHDAGLDDYFLVGGKLCHTLPDVNSVYRIEQGRMSAAPSNLLRNHSFKVWPNESSNFVGFFNNRINNGLQQYVCSDWVVKSHECVTRDIRKISKEHGGINANIDFGANGYCYFRQYVVGISQMSGGVYTFTADVYVSQEVDVDVYAMARTNSRDDNRVLVTDTPSLRLPAGRHFVSVSFRVPVLSEQFLGESDYKNMLEFALRFTSPTQKTVNVSVYQAILSPSEKVHVNFYRTLADDRHLSESYLEFGTFELTGLNTAEGQKRVCAPVRTLKWRNLLDTDIRVYDAVGNLGKVSTYDASGVRSDGIVPLSISSAGRNSSVVVILGNKSSAAGVFFHYVVNCNI